MCLLHSIPQGVYLLCTHCHRTSYIQLILVEDDFEVELAAIVNAINNNSHEVMQLKGYSSNSISKGDIWNAFHLPGNLFEKEMLIFSGYLGQWMSISIDLSGNSIFLIFMVKIMIIVIFRFHCYIINYAPIWINAEGN